MRRGDRPTINQLDLAATLYTLTPWQSVVWRSLNPAGKAIERNRCEHLNDLNPHVWIPGLDADGCTICRIWWIDEAPRKPVLAPEEVPF
jgi:hypothetical protein